MVLAGLHITMYQQYTDIVPTLTHRLTYQPSPSLIPVIILIKSMFGSNLSFITAGRSVLMRTVLHHHGYKRLVLTDRLIGLLYTKLRPVNIEKLVRIIFINSHTPALMPSGLWPHHQHQARAEIERKPLGKHS